jgi:hypothetical protein
MSQNCVGTAQLRVDEYRFSRRMHSNRNLGSLNTTLHLNDNDHEILSTLMHHSVFIHQL